MGVEVYRWVYTIARDIEKKRYFESKSNLYTTVFDVSNIGFNKGNNI